MPDASRIPFLLTQATSLLRNGQSAAAKGYLRQVLDIAPEQQDALKWLGVLAFQAGQVREAATLWQQALRTSKKDASLHCNLGLALHQLGQVHEALACLDRALALRKDFPEALNNRANVLRDLERLEEAAACYRQVLHLQPHLVEAQYNLGLTLLALQKPQEAIEWLDRCLKLVPHHASALFQRGLGLVQMGRLVDAQQSFEQVLRAHPDDLECRLVLCQVLLANGQYQAAREGYEWAIGQDGHRPQAYVGLARALGHQGLPQQALIACDRALTLNPDDVEALYERGMCLQDLRRHQEAAASYAALLERVPDYRYAVNSLALCRLLCADWTHYAEDRHALESRVERGDSTVMPFSFLAISDSARLQLLCASSYSAAAHPPRGDMAPRPSGVTHGRVRIAYVSADFGAHAMSYLMAGIFEVHDKARFELYAVRLRPSDGSPTAQRVERAFEHVVDAWDLSEAQIADLLKELAIDIAVDLMGHTENSRTGIFAARAAPIQINYLGYPGTMGADYMDYLIADAYVIPPELVSYYAEKVVYLPDCFQANDDKRQIGMQVPSRMDQGLPVDGFVFCAFNNTHKINPDLFQVWMRVLTQVPGSVLWLIAGEPATRENLCRAAQALGVDPRRLVFAHHIAYPDHLARMALADLFLDSLPFNAGTTASDALWAGLPLLTCSGQAFASRMAGSLLQAIGLPELIASDWQEYEKLAVQLATQRDALSALRQRLAANRVTSPLFDTQRFCHHLEAAYLAMWERHVQGLPAQGFRVSVQTP